MKLTKVNQKYKKEIIIEIVANEYWGKYVITTKGKPVIQ